MSNSGNAVKISSAGLGCGAVSGSSGSRMSNAGNAVKISPAGLGCGAVSGSSGVARLVLVVSLER